MNPTQILSLLKKCDSKNPMPLAILGSKTGLEDDSLIRITDEMYDARIINRCAVTRDGFTQVMLWPTGMRGKVNLRTFTINPEKIVRRDASASMPKKQEKPEMETGKSKARIMIEMIAEKGKATGRELLEASGASAVKPFIKGHLERGMIAVTGDYNDKSYALAPGVTPQQLLEDGRGYAVKKTAPRVSHFVAPPDRVAEVGKTISEPVHSLPPSRIELIMEKPRFRLACTSDKTLMMFGLSDEPIELDAAQTQLLAKFIGSSVLSHG